MKASSDDRFKGILVDRLNRIKLNQLSVHVALSRFSFHVSAAWLCHCGGEGGAHDPRRLDDEVSALNLLDRNYQLSPGFPEAGRSCLVKLRYRF